MKALFEQFGKQLIIALIVLAIVFFMFPSFVIAVAIGFVLGAVAGNYFPALETRAEDLIAKHLSKSKPRLP